MDLDVVVTGGIDDFFDFRPEATYCVIENWTQPGSGIGNTSVFSERTFIKFFPPRCECVVGS